MTPFLKKKQEVSVSSGPDEIKVRKPDEDGDAGFELLDAIVEDLMDAFHKKDKGLLKLALESLIDHIKSEDEIQDEELEY